jgi:hypothetical protein
MRTDKKELVVAFRNIAKASNKKSLYVSAKAIFNRRQYTDGFCSRYTGRFIMFSVITNIYNKKTKGPTLLELFTATGKLKKFFFIQLEIFDVCTTGVTAHIDKIFKLLPHTRGAHIEYL